MFDEKVILTRLQNGESVEDIAKELTDVLNKANHKYEDTKRAAEEAKQKRELAKRSELKALAQMAGKWYNDYIATTEEEKVAFGQALQEADIEEVISLFEGIHEIIVPLLSVIDPPIQKKEDLQEILDMFTDWFNAYYDIEVDGKLEADAVLELIDSIKEYVEALNDLESILSIKKSAVKATKSNAKSKSKSSDEKISDFLKQMGW